MQSCAWDPPNLRGFVLFRVSFTFGNAAGGQRAWPLGPHAHSRAPDSPGGVGVQGGGLPAGLHAVTGGGRRAMSAQCVPCPSFRLGYESGGREPRSDRPTLQPRGLPWVTLPQGLRWGSPSFL